MRARSGFTLIEFLVTVGVFALLLTTLALIYQGGLRAYKKTEVQVGLKRSVQAAVDQFATELREAWRVRNAGGRWRLDITKDFTTVPPVTYTVDYWYDSGRRQVMREVIGESPQVVAGDIDSFTPPPPDPIPDVVQVEVVATRQYQNHTLTIRTSTMAQKRAVQPPVTSREIVPASGAAPDPILERRYPESSRR